MGFYGENIPMTKGYTFLTLWCMIVMKAHTFLNGGDTMFIYGNDYIKFLNDDRKRPLTYDQWKNSNRQQELEKRIPSEMETNRYTNGYFSPSIYNKN